MSLSSHDSSASSSMAGAPNGRSRLSSTSSNRSDSNASSSNSAELTSALNRRQSIIEAQEAGMPIPSSYKYKNIYTEFNEFSRRQLKEYQEKFNEYDIGHDGYLDINEMTLMMEKLKAPQTRLALKEMINEVDEDQDGKVSFREFMLIFRKAAAGQVALEGLQELYRLTEVNVPEVGVAGARNFFEAKIEAQKLGSKFHEEVRREQEERQREELEKEARRQQFLERAKVFQNKD